MTLPMVLLLAIGLPGAAWLLAIGIELTVRKAEQFDWHFVDRRLLWSFIVLDQAFIAALEWKKHDAWFWLTVVCVLASATVLVKEIAAKRSRGTASNG